MKYFILTRSLDITEVGSDSQIQEITSGYNVNAPYSYRKINIQKPIDFNFIPPEFQLSLKGKITDYLHSVPTDFYKLMLVSDKFIETIKLFKLPSYCQYKSAVINKKGDSLPCWVLYFNTPFDSEFINYKKSKFTLTKYGKYVEEVGIGSKEEFWKKKETIKFPLKISFSSLVLNQDIPFDLFRLVYPFSGFLISAKLKEAIEQKNITGIEIKELSSIRPLVQKKGGGYQKMKIP